MPILTDGERIGTVVAGKYKLEEMLGRGGMGSVFRAKHEWTGRTVAVKFLHYEYARDPMLAKRFLREARAATAVRHPNIVDVLDMGDDGAAGVYLVLELLEGRPLSHWLADNKPLTLKDTLWLLLPIMDALGEAHGLGIVHRDIKPDNIFLAQVGRTQIPKLLDFGIAKVSDGESSGHGTQAGAIIGTPAYMSPEQVRGEPNVDAASDVWALGVVLYECLTGQVPFDSESTSGILLLVLQSEVPPVTKLAPDLPPPIAAIIHRALARDRAMRFASAAELAAALRQEALSQGGELPAFTALRHSAVPARETPLSTVADIPVARGARFAKPLLVLAALSAVAIVTWALWPAAPVIVQAKEGVPVQVAPAQAPAPAPATIAPNAPARELAASPAAVVDPPRPDTTLSSPRARRDDRKPLAAPPRVSPPPSLPTPPVSVLKETAPAIPVPVEAPPKARERQGRDAPTIREDW